MNTLIVRAGVVFLLLVAIAVGSETQRRGPGEPADQTGRPALPNHADGPRLRILGSVQDGGLPHAACSCPRCEAARDGDRPARYVASLALIGPASGGRENDRREIHLIDATPDIRAQLVMLGDVRPFASSGVDRDPIDGVLLTHAHMGHYLGLAHFGYESVHTQGLEVRCSARMAAFVRANQPWEQMVDMGEIEIIEIAPDEPLEIAATRITPVLVPHRDEHSDTLAFIFERAAADDDEPRDPRERPSGGGRRSRPRVLYLPDCDPWHRWEDRALALIRSVDVAILDATFFDGEELPGRDLSKIGHPLAADTIALLADRVRSGELRVILTHMNHSNPLLDADSAARRRAIEAGFEIAAEGGEIPL